MYAQLFGIKRQTTYVTRQRVIKETMIKKKETMIYPRPCNRSLNSLQRRNTNNEVKYLRYIYFFNKGLPTFLKV